MRAMRCYSSILLVGLCLAQQRVAPGVPPQHYQHQPPAPNQYDPQQQAHLQGVQGQGQGSQQVPVQHVQQVPVQQIHQQNPHGHQHHTQSNQILSSANIAAEKQHIQEHMDVPIDTSKMTDQELQFHYFKMHDADNNNKLDGCELIKSLIHWHEQGRKEQGTQGTSEQPPEHKIFHDEELLKLIEPILGADDGNNDGFIDYPEFIRAQKKAQVQQKQQQQQQQQQQSPPLR